MLTVVELFSGIGSQRAALERAGIQHKIVAFCDIDKFAEQSYRAIFNDNETPNLGDITKVEKLPKCDLLTYSFPCTDISLAGKRKGLVNPNKVDDGLFQFDEVAENTRSGLLYEVQRLLKNSELPKYLLLENVKELVGKKNMRDFQNWCDDLNDLGYNTYWKVLDAQFYGVPQHRKRVYAISIRKDIDKGKFRFPQGWELLIRLKDILEENVDEKYYLSEKILEKLKIKDKITETCGIDLNTKECHTRQIASTIAARYDCTYSNFSPGSTGVVLLNNNYYRIRKLTPLECWRCMGFDDIQFYQAQKVNSNAQLYKQAGNSIVVNVLVEIFKEMMKNEN